MGKTPQFRLANLSDLSLRWFALAIVLASLVTVSPGTGSRLWFALVFLAYTGLMQVTVQARKDSLGWFWLATAADFGLATLWSWQLGQKFSLYHLPVILMGLRWGFPGAITGGLAGAALYSAGSYAATGAVTFGVVLQRVMFYLPSGLVAAFLGREIDHQRREQQRLGAALSELETAHEKIKEYARLKSQQAITDGLTGLHNHTYLQKRIEEEIKRTTRHGRPTSMIMIDLDNFKKFNDTYGHLRGNEVLKEIAQVITGSVREVDLVARYGGDEFAVLVPEADTETTAQIGERIRQSVDSRLAGTPAGALGVSLSLGVATVPRHAQNRLELIEQADRAMYRSKASGKNQVAPLT